MGLVSYKSYRESSASTRNKAAAAKGLQPLYSADVFGHSTPPPDVVKKLLKKIEKKKKDKDEVSEGKIQRPDYSFDSFIKKAEKASEDTDKELKQAEKDVDKIEKTSKDKKNEKEKLLNKPDLKPKPFPPIRLNADKTVNVKDEKPENEEDEE